MTMNNENPLVPQGSLLEQKNKGRARVRLAVFFVLAVHGLGLLALLMQGCNKPPEAPPPAPEQTTETNNPPPFEAPTNAPPPDASNAAPVTAPAPVPAPAPEVAAVVPTVGATDYKVAKGDTYSTIAKKFHVPVKAISDANPGVQPTKLQIGQTLHIPAAAAPAPAAVSSPGNAGATLPTEAAGGEQPYTVKSGDTLSRIASHFGTSVKALRSANSLKTDSIKVGQKLKIPVKAAAAPATPATPPPAPEPSTPAPAGTSTPTTVPPGR